MVDEQTNENVDEEMQLYGTTLAPEDHKAIAEQSDAQTTNPASSELQTSHAPAPSVSEQHQTVADPPKNVENDQARNGVDNAAKSSADTPASTVPSGQAVPEGGSADEPAGENDADDDDDDDDEEEDDEDEDDFDVIVNTDDVDTNAAAPGAQIGPIGKVRLMASTTKWQRPGFTAPERVLGNQGQPVAKPGGVLSMLPNPTMQIGTSQKSVYDLEIGKLTEKPWLDRGADQSDYFNYGFNEDTWKLYCERQMQMRLEASMLAKIKTVDGNKNPTPSGSRPTQPAPPKNTTLPPGSAGRAATSGAVIPPPGLQTKISQPPAGMIPPPPGLVPPGAMPNMPKMMQNMPKLPNMPNMPPFAFPPGAPNAKGGAFQPPFQFPPLPGGQRNGDGKGNNMFPFLPGMPGIPGMPMPPGGMPPGLGRGAPPTMRGFPGHMQQPQQLQQNQSQQTKNVKNAPSNQGGPDTSQGRGSKRMSGSGDTTSRFGPAQSVPNKQGASQQQSRQGQHAQHQGGHMNQQEDDRRRNWNSTRSGVERRQGYDRQGGDRAGHMGSGGHAEGRGRGAYDDRGYADRNDRRRSGNGWGDNRDEGSDRRRGGGYDNQRYTDGRRDYDRDRDRDYRKRAPGSRDYGDDRKRIRR